MELKEYIELSRPLEQRLQGLNRFPGKVKLKLDTILDSDIGFYEKLFFIQNMGGETNGYLERLLAPLELGEIVAQLLKPHLMRLGEKAYPALDFSLIFCDEPMCLSRPQLEDSFLRTVYSEEDESIWQHLENTAESVISRKYSQGLSEFVEVLSSFNASQPFLKGNPEFVFRTGDEMEYILSLYSWAHQSPRVDTGKFPKILLNFIEQAAEGKSRKRKLRTEKDVRAQLAGMKQNHVTIFGMEFQEAYVNPVFMTYRAKTLRSAAGKASAGYSALIAFHGEGIAEKIYDEFPWLLEGVIRDRRHNKQSLKEYVTVQRELHKVIYGATDGKVTWAPLERDEKRRANWRSLPDDTKARLWAGLPQYVRSKIIASEGSYGNLIEKYNTWGDVVDIFKDLFGISLVYADDNYRTHAEKQIINPLYAGKLPGLRPVKGAGGGYTRVDYIDTPKYHATHMDVTISGKNSIELHVTSIRQLLLNDAVGEGCHILYHKQRLTKLLDVAPPVRHLVNKIEDVLGEKTVFNGNTSVSGYLSPLKNEFPGFKRKLQEYGLIR
jgi:hypothetical protein